VKASPLPSARTPKLSRGWADGRLEFEVVLDQGQLAGLDLRQIQHVVQHRQQQAARTANHVEPLALHRGQVAERHHLGHREHAVQGRADLVAHIGQELGLQDVGGVGGVAGLLQLAHGALQVFLALVQLAQQVVEALGQAGEQIVGGVHRDRLEAAARGHLAHGARQALHRLDDAVGQAPRQEERDAHPAEQQHEAEGDELGQHRREFGLAHGDLQPAHGLARHDDGPFDDFEVVGAGGLTGPAGSCRSRGRRCRPSARRRRRRWR
jgi:hypothetical protein